MSRIYLLDPLLVNPEASDWQRAAYTQTVACAERDRYKRHQTVSEPADADCIIAPMERGGYGPFFEKLRASRFSREYGDRLFVYSPDPNQYPSLPGVYPSAQRRWVEARWVAGGHYISSLLTKHEFTARPFAERDILFSFVGSTFTHPVRERLVRLRHPRAELFDSSPRGDKQWWAKGEEHMRALRAKFHDVTARSQFVLCPRGIAPPSIRLFETMEAGAVPVVISDACEFPVGPDWDAFTLRIAEADVDEVPARIEAVADAAEAMGARARQAWEAYFSPESSFNSLVDWTMDLRRNLPADRRRSLSVQAALGEYLAPTNVRAHLRGLKSLPRRVLAGKR